jgi:hypothetical protein
MLVSALFCTIWQYFGLFDKYNMYILGKYKIGLNRSCGQFVALNISMISLICIIESLAYIPSSVPWDNKTSTKQSTGLAIILLDFIIFFVQDICPLICSKI